MAIIIGDAGDNVLTGSGDSDILEGLGGNDTLTGLAGDDLLEGGAGNDALFGEDGDDHLWGGLGDDLLNGGAGNDVVSFYGATSGVTVNLNLQGLAQNTGEGLDTLTSIENLEGSRFDDVLIGDDNANTLTSVRGNDILEGRGGNDAINISYNAHPNEFIFAQISADGGTGDDVLTLGAFNLDAGLIKMDGGAGDDVMSVDSSSSGGFELRMDGGAGNDSFTVAGTVGAAIKAGDGDDLVTLDVQGFHSVYLGTGADRIVLTGSSAHPPQSAARITVYDFTAGFGGDVIDLSTFLTSAGLVGFTPGSNPFETGHLRITRINDENVQLEVSIDGGVSGYQPLVRLEVPETSLTSHNFGGYRPVPAVINGSSFRDHIQGIDEDDVLNGLGGSDTLIGRGGHDTLDGGDGDDLVFGDYYLSGDQPDGDDVLTGGAGNDILIGGGGDDRLSGGAGIDILITGVALNDSPAPPGSAFGFVPILDHARESGTDVVDGGTGMDTAYLLYGASTQAVAFDNSNLAAVNQITIGGVARGSVTGVELLKVYGGSANDSLTGGIYGDLLVGNAGDDTLSGGKGWDVLEGGDGADILSGGDDIDQLTGGAGDDTLDGGLGDDTIIGGAGWDTLLLSGSRDDYRVLRSGDDYIVKGLDGSDRVCGVEILRFSDGGVIDLARQVGPTADGKSGEDPFVLPARPDDLPLVLPGVEAGKSDADPLVLPGAGEPAPRLFAGLEARLGPDGDWMATLEAESRLIEDHAPRDGWLF